MITENLSQSPSVITDGEVPMSDDAEPGRVETAVRKDLGEMPDDLRESGLAAAALDLAIRLDVPGVRPAAAAMLSAQLRATLLELAKLAPPRAKEDDLDELRARRASRLA